MDENPTTINVCVVCQQAAPFKCTACKTAAYCGVQHQKDDWRNHRTQCRPFCIRKSPEIGRYLMASRDIPAHSIIFTELPLVHGPKWCLDEGRKDEPYFPCIGCFCTVRIGDRTCPVCFWPACSSNCAGLTNPNGHGIECALLSTQRGIKPAQATDHRTYLDFYRSDALLVLRCLLLQYQFPDKWDKVQTLGSHDEERRGTQYYADADERIVSYLLRHFLNTNYDDFESKMGATLLPLRDAATLHRICGILETNALNAEVPSAGDATREISALYEYACVLEHSCTPNCYYTIDAKRKFRVTMRAGRAIAKGEHLAIMYTHMLWGTQMRRDHLLTNKYFHCQCARCRDPTELGTNLSAMRCLGDMGRECNGIVLLTDPLLNKTDWQCDRCDVRIDREQVDVMLSHIEQEVDDVLAGQSPPTVRQLEALIAKLSTLLHPSHYHLFALEYALLQGYGHESSDGLRQLSDDELMAKVVIGKHLMATLDILDPHAMRLAIYKASILYELYVATVEEARRRQFADDHRVIAIEYLTRGKEALAPHSDMPQEKKFLDIFNRASIDLNAAFSAMQIQ